MDNKLFKGKKWVFIGNEGRSFKGNERFFKGNERVFNRNERVLIRNERIFKENECFFEEFKKMFFLRKGNEIFFGKKWVFSSKWKSFFKETKTLFLNSTQLMVKDKRFSLYNIFILPTMYLPLGIKCSFTHLVIIFNIVPSSLLDITEI